MARIFGRRWRNSARNSRRTVILAAAAAFPAWSALAAARTWNTSVNDGDWNSISSWNVIFPVAGDDAYLLANTATDYLATFNLATNPHFNILRIGNTAPGTNVFALQLNSALTMTFGVESVGYDGRGVYNQSNGTNSLNLINSFLNLGELATGNGTYTLSGGLLTVPFVNVGLNGSGNFVQSGGTHVATAVTLAYGNNSKGSYTLSAGTLNLSNDLFVGYGATSSASFTQTGGAVTLARDLQIGAGTNSAASYALSNSASLTINNGNEYIGFSGSGTFNQTGGTHTLNPSTGSNGLFLAFNNNSSGIMNLSGGTFTVNGGIEDIGHFPFSSNGTFNQSGGLHTSTGTIKIGISGAYNLNGGTLTANTLNVVSGSFTQTAGSSTFNSISTVNVGNLTLLGGSVTVSSLNMGASSSRLVLHGATMTAETFIDPGTFNGAQTIGSLDFQFGTLDVGIFNGVFERWLDGPKTLQIRGSDLLVGGASAGSGNPGGAFGQSLQITSNQSLKLLNNHVLVIGDTNGAGTFGVDGSGIVDVGAIVVNSSGTLNLTGGTLSTGSALRAAGSTVNFTGGALNITNLPFTIGVAGFLGAHPDLTPNMSVAATQGTIIDGGASLTLDGGTYTTSALSVATGGSFVFNGGTIKFLNGFDLGNNLADPTVITLSNLGPGKNIVAQSAGLTSGAFLYMSGGSFSATGLTQFGIYPISNYGEIQLDSPFSFVSGNEIGNYGLIDGNGRLNATSVYNLGELRAVAGQRLLVAGSLLNGSTSLNNTPVTTAALNALGGTIEVTGNVSNVASINLTGGVLKAGGILTNGPTGTIAGRGTLMAASINNAGQMNFTSGNTDIFAPVVNTATAKIIVSGGGVSTFYNPVSGISGTEIRISTNSAAVFFGAVTGPISFTGTGAKYFEGGISQAGPIAAGGVTVVDAPASLTVDYIREKSLSVTGQMAIRPNGPASKVNTLSIDSAAGGKLDLANNALIVDYATPADSPIASVRAMLIAGYANGTWTGNGIASSTAAADSHKALGYAEASQALGAKGGTFSGLDADGTSVLIRYTLKGDTNFDGVVGFADLVAVAQHYGAVGSGSWFTGDTNYDGNVGFADLVAVAQNYGHDLSGAAIPGATPEFARDFDQAWASSVPEPGATGALVAFAIGGMAARRRRYRRRTQGQGSGGDRV